jgi:hypothetical protein
MRRASARSPLPFPPAGPIRASTFADETHSPIVTTRTFGNADPFSPSA